MIKKIKNTKTMVVLLLVMITFSCKPDPLEYAAPAGLVGTLYVQLESLGNFNHYLAALDRTEYADPLKKGGSWTIFAPNDEAFSKFMKEEGYATVADIPSTRLYHLVQHTIIKDSWNTTNLTFNIIRTNSGFYEGNALKRYTEYADSLTVVTKADYPNMKDDVLPGRYKIDLSRGVQKPITYILPSYMQSQRLEVEDVNYVFEGIDYQEENDMNVFEANVVKTNIVSENGMIFTIDKVIEPRINLYQNLTSPEYGEKYTLFKHLLERFAYFNSKGNVEIVEGEAPEEIFELAFRSGVTNQLLPFDPNTDTYPRLQSNVDKNLTDSTGLIVPSNDALEAYLQGDNPVAELYDSYDDMSDAVLFKFLSTFFFTRFGDVCPSNDGQHFNVELDQVNFLSTDAVDKKMCSNGFFVGVDQIYQNSSFGTVLGQLLLDVDYSIMNKTITDLKIDNQLKGAGTRFSILGVRNDQFKNVTDPTNTLRRISVKAYNENLSVIQITVTGDPVASNNRDYPRSLTNPDAVDVRYVENILQAIVESHIINEEIDINSTNYYQTESGDYVQISNNTVAGAEDIRFEESKEIYLDSIIETSNGKFYITDGAISNASRYPYGALLQQEGDNYSLFLKALESAKQTIDVVNGTTISSDDKNLLFISPIRTYSLLVPNNTAMQQAIDDGVIGDPNQVPELIKDPVTDVVDPDSQVARDNYIIALENFVKLHFIQQSLVTDGFTTGTFNSLFNTIDDDVKPEFLPVEIVGNSTTGGITVKRKFADSETIKTSGITNLFSRNVVVHEINSYLKF